MSRDTLIIPEPLRDRLREALIYFPDLERILKASPREPVSTEPGLFRVDCALPIPRQMDPETSELRVLNVYLREVAGGSLEIQRIDGLEPVAPA
ncbi:MAG: hypothetical protein KDD11_23625 [Acidobacteria bacterium]|nr:hypothetical protein [Acidobacteriota bacterium]